MAINNNTILLNQLKNQVLELPDRSPSIDNSIDLTQIKDTTAADILSGKKFVTSSGAISTGTMPNNGTTLNKTITSNGDINIPKGYHSGGTLTVKVASSGGIDTSDATAQGKHILEGKTAYAKGQQITGTIATKTSSDITIQQNKIAIPSGYYESDIEKETPFGILADPIFTTTDNGANELTITAKNQVETAGYIPLSSYHTNEITINPAKFSLGVGNNQVKYNVETAGYASKGSYGSVSLSAFDSDFKASNIKKDVSIFGITGTYEGSVVTEDVNLSVGVPSTTITIKPTNNFRNLYLMIIASMGDKEDFYSQYPGYHTIHNFIYHFKSNTYTANSHHSDNADYYPDNSAQFRNSWDYYNTEGLIDTINNSDVSSNITIELNPYWEEYFGGNYFVMLVGSL